MRHSAFGSSQISLGGGGGGSMVLKLMVSFSQRPGSRVNATSKHLSCVSPQGKDLSPKEKGKKQEAIPSPLLSPNRGGGRQKKGMTFNRERWLSETRSCFFPPVNLGGMLVGLAVLHDGDLPNLLIRCFAVSCLPGIESLCPTFVGRLSPFSKKILTIGSSSS